MTDACIRFDRQPNGTYLRSGELPPGTIYAVVQYPMPLGGVSVSLPEKVSHWLGILEAGPLRGECYILRPSNAPNEMSEETKTARAVVSAAKKAAKREEKQDLQKEEAEIAAENGAPRNVSVALVRACKAAFPETKPTLDEAKIIEMYNAGARLVDITVAVGFKRGYGNSACRNVLIKAGIFKKKEQV